MPKKIFVNLPVRSLAKTMDFFGKLGYSFNKQFTDDNAACLVVSDDIYVMLLSIPMFEKLTTKKALDARTGAECTVALSLETKEAVDAWADKALALGATENTVPEMKQEDYMYGRSMNDLDGHIWEIFWMNPKMVQKK